MRWFGLVVLHAVALALVLPAAHATAAEVRIRLLRQQGRQVHVYHDHGVSAGQGDAEVLLGATTCRPVKGESLRPGRGGDALTTLIVLDRGGTASSGMGQYSDAIREAVGGFLEGIVGKGPGDKVTLIDTWGRDSEPRKLAPTNNMSDVKAFLADLPTPTGSGADVYGVAALGLEQLERANTPLGAVIIISDGIDPAADKDKSATDNHQMFIREAKKRGVPVAAMHVGRSATIKGDDDTKFRNGRARLADCANETNGDLVTIAAGPDLSANLRKELDQLGQLFAQVERTTCEPCGKVDAKIGAAVDLKVRKGGTVLMQSLGLPPPRIDLAGDDYGDCAGLAADVSGASAACTTDANCPADSTCDPVSHKCRPREGGKRLLPWLIGGLALLGVALALWARARRNKREQDRLNTERDLRETALKEAAETADAARRRAEAERQAALAQAAQAQQAANDALTAPRNDHDPALQQLLHPDVVRLASAPGSVEAVDMVLKAGVYMLGGADEADIRLHSATVSMHHAQLEVDKNGGLRLMDLGSSNGTYVNQVRIAPRTPVELRVGDLLGFSRSVLLQLHGVAGAARPGPMQRPAKNRTVLEE
jgi:hypothetical protein